MSETNTPPETQAGDKQKKKTFYISIRVKLLIVFILLYAIIFGGVSAWFYSFATDAVMNRLEDDLDTLMTGVSAQIDGDEFRTLVEEGGEPTAEGSYPAKAAEDGTYPDEVSELYWTQAAFLYQMRSIDPRARFYTYAAGDEPNEVVFVGSSSAAAPEPSGAKFLQSVIYPPADAEVILGGLDKKTFFLDIYDDPNFPGGWISGYIPIKNSAGETVGGLGVDFLASYVREVQQDVKDGIMVATGLTFALVVIMVFLISGVLTRPVFALTKIAARIGEGDYEQDLSALTSNRLSDEIGTLAQVFEIMVGKVRQREEKLKKQVIELQIMIDESKRQEQVDEIVESDFFRDLQTKAQDMRKGFAAAQAGHKSEPEPES